MNNTKTIYYLLDCETGELLLKETQRNNFIKEGLKVCKNLLRQRLVTCNVQNDYEMYEMIDRFNKIKNNIVMLETNKTNEVSNELKLLKTITVMLDVKVKLKCIEEIAENL